MLWPFITLALAHAAASSNPLMTGLFFRVEHEVVRTFAPCEHISDDPSTARCRRKVYGHSAELLFVFDETKRVHAVLLAFPPVPRLDDTEALMKPIADTLSGQFGPPKADKTDTGATWTWSGDHGVATMKLMKTGEDAWLVTASLKEGRLPGRFGPTP